ncbi:conserved Plasmodium protein, unknown function [Plasmodium ovale curtisi]|uniref:Uncharacterized protein n=1 Tax=Plasmodium ovale curtisi TaxID=864141 RepID=A0A1A8WXS3_PLAOA|nr:conserved Plasmodium protein, unknown function [Plasmodium ovale curtisi]SBS96683.1 conserved Plasmodium protein, unknown function [Plasmodium ovale curtisi]
MEKSYIYSNIYSFRGVFFEIKVEMYQWVRDYGYLGLFARGRFEDHVVRTPYNFFFFYKSRKNPTYMPSVGSVGRKYANYAKAGSYRLPKNSLINFQKKKKLDLVDDGWFTESEIKPPYTIDHLNTNVYDNYLYTGDPLNPQVGDIRISFYGSASTHATVIGVQKSRLLNTMFGIDSVNIMKHNIILISEDNKIMINKTKDFIHRNYGNIKSLWLFRIITYLFLSGQIFSLLVNSSKVAKYTHVPNRCTDIYEEYNNNEENKINTILDSSSDVSFYNPIHKSDGAKFESSPAGLYHHS